MNIEKRLERLEHAINGPEDPPPLLCWYDDKAAIEAAKKAGREVQVLRWQSEVGS